MINLVIPAAGAATRLRPLSAYTSKAMVRVNGKPCIDYILEQANKLAQINEIVIVDGKYDDIREYCGIKHPNVKFVKQESLSGPKNAIEIGLKQLTDPSLPLVVWLGDAIILEDNLELGKNFLLCKEVNDHHNWCMWDQKDFYDKPTQHVNSGVALVGLYSFLNGKDAFEAFMDNPNAYDISEALYVYGSTRFERVMTDKWYDIGDLPTYYKTCAELLKYKARAFHSMEYDSDLGVIRKRPDFHNDYSIQTIKNEKAWYANLTPEQQMFVPRVLPHNTDLIMSYESGTLLSDLMLYESLTESAWEYIIDKVFRIKLQYFNQPADSVEFVDGFANASNDMWITKSISRLNDQPSNFFSEKEKASLVEKAKAIARMTKPTQTMHGDLHFGNILYDQQTDKMKLIDPRGRYGEFDGTQGDDLYDFAKLAHDLYHGYNAMVVNVKPNQIVKGVFIKTLERYKLPKELIIDGGLLLIATCIPLHYEDSARQQRFIDYVKGQL
jgi:glucose-1-phosphate thymidylyltransferase